MKHDSKGNAITGIIIIVLILLAGAIYMYQMTKVKNDENKANAERAMIEQSAGVGMKASVEDSFGQ